MILPKDVKGRKKLRDSKIISLYIEKGETTEKIALDFKITSERVNQILRNNASVAIANYKDFSKVKRINFFERALASSDELPIAKTQLELVEANRREFEKDSQVTTVTQFLSVIPNKDAQHTRISEHSTRADEDNRPA